MIFKAALIRPQIVQAVWVTMLSSLVGAVSRFLIDFVDLNHFLKI